MIAHMDKPAPVAHRGFPWPLAVVTALLLLALGWGTARLLAPPLLCTFLIYLLFPYRGYSWAFRSAVIVLIVGLLWVVDRFASILLILAFSLFLSYLLDPAVAFMERHRIRRTVAILALLVPVVAAGALILILVLPPLVQQLGELLNTIPTLAESIQKRIEPLLKDSRLEPFYARYEQEIPRLLQSLQDLLLQSLRRVFDATRALGEVAAAAVLVPFTTFYFLRDYRRLRARGEELVPRAYHERISDLGGELDRLLGQWLRGAAIVALIVGVVTGVGLFLLGIPYPLLLAAMAALMNFVPVVGFWISFVVAAITALVAVGWPALLQVSALYFGLSVLEAQLLQPRIVGEAVGLHPVAMIVALIIFADAFGLLGAFVAVPLAILILILARQARAFYLASDIYTDSPPEPSEE